MSTSALVPVNLLTSTTAPTVPTLAAGDTYYNASTRVLYVYDGAVWTAVGAADATKADKLVTINPQSASYTLVAGDADKMVEVSNASANTLTVPPNSSVAYAIGTKIDVLQTGAGQTTITPGSGVTINGTPGLKLRAQWSACTLIKRATDTWACVGDLSA